MGARNGVSVEKRLMPDGKNWVFVTTKPTGSAMGFWDWYEQLRLLRECEAEKYPHSPDPDALPRAFFDACFNTPMPDWEELCRIYRIPDRGQVA